MGGITTIECQVSDPPANHVVTFLRRTATENERLTWNDIVYSTNDRMSFTKRGEGMHLLTITKVNKEGECIIVTLNFRTQSKYIN